MGNEKRFSIELNELITRYIKGGAEPRDIVDELIREANLVFARNNLEIYLAARKRA